MPDSAKQEPQAAVSLLTKLELGIPFLQGGEDVKYCLQFMQLSSKNSLWESIIISLAIVGLCAAITENDSCIYEVYSYICDPFRMVSKRPFLYLTFILGHVFFWFTAVRYGNISSSVLARCLLPLVVLCGHFVIIFLQLRNSYWSLYTTSFLVGLSGFFIFQAWDRHAVPEISHKKAVSLMIFLGLCFITYEVYFQHYMYTRLSLGYPDIGIYFKRIWNTMYGAFHQVNSSTPPFTYHFAPGLLLIVPLVKLFPSIYLLIFLQAFFIGITGYLLFYLAIKRNLSPWIALGIGVGYYLYPATSQLTFNYSYGFHSPTLGLPFLVIAIYWIDQKSYLKAIIPSLLAISMQEYIAVYFIGGGFAWICGKRYRVGILCLFLASLYFLGIVQSVMPSMAGVRFWEPLGSSMTEIAFSPFTKPTEFSALLFHRNNLHLVILLLLPLGFLPLFAPRFLLMLSPVFLFNFLRPSLMAKSIAFQYQTGTIGILFLGVIMALSDQKGEALFRFIRKGEKSQRWQASAVGAMLIISLMLSFYVGLLPWSRTENNAILPSKKKMALNHDTFKEIQSMIPQEATITGDDRTMAMFLTHRLVIKYGTHPEIQTEYHVYQEGYFRTPREKTIERVNILLASGKYEEIYRKNECHVLKRKTPLEPLHHLIF